MKKCDVFIYQEHLQIGNKLLLFFTAVFLLAARCNDHAIPKNNSFNTADKRLYELLGQKEYFRLETELNLLAGNVDNKWRLYFQSFVDNAFNRNEASIERIDTLLKNYGLVETKAHFYQLNAMHQFN